MLDAWGGENNKTAALAIVEDLGWPVFPLWGTTEGECDCGKGCESKEAGKHPIGKLAPSGFKNATADPATVAKWWEQYPNANVAIPTGEATGLWVLDLDGVVGLRDLAQIVDAGGYDDLPETPQSKTGGDGKHHFFTYPADIAVKNQTKLAGRNIDVRGEGGYVVLPPSTNGKGGYRWERSPDKYELEPAPDWLLMFATTGVLPAVKPSPATGPTFTMGEDLDFANHPGAGEGERNDTLCRLAGAYLAKHGATPELFDLAIAWNHRCKPSLDDDVVRRKLVKLAEKHAKQSPGKAAAPSPGSKLHLVRYADIAPEQVSWLWQNRIPLGKVSILSGDPGIGKTFLTLDITSHVTTGKAFIDGSLPTKGEVIFLTFEDGAGDTIRPRLDAMGADPAKVFHLDCVRDAQGKESGFTIDVHLPLLEEQLIEHPDVRLLIIDPISAALGKSDSHNNAEVRGTLGPLAKLADKYRVAVVGINHLSKSQGSVIYRSLGSIAFVAAARAAWAVVCDPDDPERKLFLPIKNNLAAANGLAYRLVDGRVEWEIGELLIAVDDVTADNEGTPRSEAKEWLLSLLGNGDVEAASILKLAKRDGICERTLKYAKKELGVTSHRDGDKWYWKAPGVSRADTITRVEQPDGGVVFRF